MSKARTAVTYRLESPDQGGLEYARCNDCGRESVTGDILHREGCSNR